MSSRKSLVGVVVVFGIVVAVILTVLECTGRESLVSDDVSLDWNRYYTTDETHRIMREFADMYPNLTNMYSIGKSLLKTDLYVIEISNMENKPPEEKPAIYVDGNLHSGELTGSAVTMYLLGYLLNNYGTDPQVTELLDTRAFYLRPKFNPDGSDLALLHNVSLRSTVRPFDNDGDGTADEDPPDDLDGDGVTTRMRIPDPAGQWKKDPNDPRIMTRRAAGETGGEYFRLESEGIDNDGDGRLNEDGIGGLDLNRNFPRNWELQYLQSGAGAFPLSEPETYAALQFLNEKTNVTFIIHNHTSGGFVYRLPSTADPSLFPPDDLELIKSLSDIYTQTTGRPVRRSYTTPARHRYGTLISWAYWDRGIIGWVPEYWPGIENDADGDGITSETEQLQYVMEELDGRYFTDWTRYDHPEFGPVEIGGWHRMYISQNPPPELLEKECAAQIPWILRVAERSPLLTLSDPVVTEMPGDLYEICVTATNTGYLPTNLTERGIIAGVVRPVEAEITLVGASLAQGSKKVVLGHIAGSRITGSGKEPSSQTAAWVVRKEAQNATVSIRVISEKGGTVSTGAITLK